MYNKLKIIPSIVCQADENNSDRFEQYISIELFIDDKKIDHFVNSYAFFTESMGLSNSRFYPITCSCLIPQCANINTPISVSKFDTSYHWSITDILTIDLIGKDNLNFKKENYENELLNLFSFLIKNKDFICSFYGYPIITKPFSTSKDLDPKYSIEQKIKYFLKKYCGLSEYYVDLSFKYDKVDVGSFIKNK